MEHESIEIIACDDEPCDPKDEAVPPDRTLYAGRVRGGWHAELVGIELGASVYQAWDGNDDRQPKVLGFPQLEIKLGPERLHGRLGLGDPFLTTVRRPGLYSVLGADLGDRHGVEVGLSALRAGPGAPADDMNLRIDTVGRLGLGKFAYLRLGGAMWAPETSRFEGELSVGFGARIE